MYRVFFIESFVLETSLSCNEVDLETESERDMAEWFADLWKEVAATTCCPDGVLPPRMCCSGASVATSDR